MRTRYIVTYDVSEKKRLRRVFKTCKNFGTHLQFSVFECDLTPTERIQMEEKLKETIKADADQVLFIRLGPANERTELSISALGQPYTAFDAPCYVV
jgi:CRISPR-associated protein Cas2